MKSREAALRLKRFEADEKARKVGDLEYMINDFEQMASDLDRQIAIEEDRTGVKDVTHFAYSTFAKSASQRRDNLLSSANELREKLADAQRDLDDAKEMVDRADNVDARDDRRTSHTVDEPSSAALR